MNNKLIVIMILLFISSAASLTYALPSNVEYNAVHTITEGTEKSIQKIYFKPNKLRLEMPDNINTKADNYFIFNFDKNVGWLVLDKAEIYMDSAVKDNQDFLKYHDLNKEKYVNSGSSELLGQDCIRYEYTDGNQKNYYWATKDSNIILKVVIIKNGKIIAKMDTLSINFGKQPDSLFVIPAGYSYMDDLGGSKK